MLSPLPTGNRARIDAKLGSQFPLAEPITMAEGDYPFAKSFSRCMIGLVAQERTDLGHELEVRTCSVMFPVPDRHLVHSESRSESGLREPEVKALLAEVFGQGRGVCGVSGVGMKGW